MAENMFQRTGGVWYARVAAPKRLRELRKQLGVTGKTDVPKSLRTKDRQEAKRRHPSVLEGIYREFEAEEARLLSMGARPDVTFKRPDEHDFQRAAFAFVQEELRLDELARIDRPTPEQVEREREVIRQNFATNPPTTDLERVVLLTELSRLKNPRGLDPEYRRTLVEELKLHQDLNETALVDWAIDDLAQKNHWSIEKGSVEYKALARHLMRLWISALKTTFQRDEGIYDSEVDVVSMAPAPALSATPAATGHRSNKPKRGESLRDHLDAYLREQKAHAKPNTLRDARAAVRQFIECNGDRPIESYTKADMAKFKRLLVKAPARTEKLYPGVPLPKAVDLNQRDGHPLLRSNSVRNKLSTLAAFGKWLEGNFPGGRLLEFRHNSTQE